MNRPKIVVEVNGGVVQAVYSDDPETTVALVDWDSEDSGPTEPNLVTATGADGREYLGFVGEIPADAWDAMPQETREAVQKGTDWMNRTNEPKSPDRNFLPFLSLVPPSSLHTGVAPGLFDPNPNTQKLRKSRRIPGFFVVLAGAGKALELDLKSLGA